MRTSTLKYAILSAVYRASAVLLALLPFHAFMTVWLASATGHYTAIRLWKEVVLLIIVAGAIFLVTMDKKIREHTLSRRLVWLIQAYVALVVIRGAVALAQGDVTEKALGYGLIIDLRFLLFFLVVWAAAVRTNRLRKRWKPLILWPAALVVAFGLLQALVLPHDILRHFGYGPHTISAVETINHNSNYVRIASTLRGANPLGAYLLIPISVLGVLLARSSSRRNWQYALLAGSYIVLFFSFSRSAWIGAVLATGIVLATNMGQWVYRKQIMYASAAAVLAIIGLGIGFRHNAHFQNVIFHTEDKSVVKVSSNQGHASALKDGVHDVLHEPLGRGTGTAGPASVYNDQPARISENYFIQVGQETGWLGLILFSTIMVGVGYLLWIRRSDTLALSLFAAFIGLTFINMLSHAWADDTLAYVFWGLAGLAMVPDATGNDLHKNNVAKDAKPKKSRTKSGR